MDKQKSKIFFFFPYYQTGGAEKAHLAIVRCLRECEPKVFFTDRSRDNKNKKEFYSLAQCHNFFGLNNKLTIVEKVLVFWLARKINQENKAVVFGSNSRFFYALIKKLKPSVKVIDLVHWLDGEMGERIIENSERVNKRVVVTKGILPVLERVYQEKGVDLESMQRVQVVENFVSRQGRVNKNFSSDLQVLYVGRGTSEKRADLAFLVEQRLQGEENIHFTFVGRGLKKFGQKNGSEATIIDSIKNEANLNELYVRSHILILTSLFEGFPYAVMEAMSFGVVPVCTAVGGIPEHLKNSKNAILTGSESKEEIVNDISRAILDLQEDRYKLKRLSSNSWEYAKNNFSEAGFCENYKKIILE